MTKDAIAESFALLGQYGERLQKAREAARQTYRAQETKPRNDVRTYIDMLVARLVTTVNTPIFGVNESASYQISLSASFIRTHFVINDLIMNGDLLEAATLIRKQLESAARMNELDTGPLKGLLKRPPNVKALFKNDEGAIYGALSEAAHFGRPRIANLLSILEEPEKSIATVSVYPSYNANALTCFDMQHVTALYFLGWMIGKLQDWYPNRDLAVERELFVVALHTADQAGVIQLPQATES